MAPFSVMSGEMLISKVAELLYFSSLGIVDLS